MDIEQNNPGAAVPVVNEVAPVRARPPRRRRVVGGIRRRRPVYTQAQKDRAVRMLNMGMTCRQVARSIGPHCSSGTPIRWRQQARAANQVRARMEAAVRVNPAGEGQNAPDPNVAQIDGQNDA